MQEKGEDVQRGQEIGEVGVSVAIVMLKMIPAELPCLNVSTFHLARPAWARATRVSSVSG